MLPDEASSAHIPLCLFPFSKCEAALKANTKPVESSTGHKHLQRRDLSHRGSFIIGCAMALITSNLTTEAKYK